MPFSFFRAHWKSTGFLLSIWLLILSPIGSAISADPANKAPSPERQDDLSVLSPLALTIDQAILLAFENNPSLRIERLNPEIQQTFVEQARSVFDPVVSGQTTYSQARGLSSSNAIPFEPDTEMGAVNLELGIAKRLPTGTQIGIDLSVDHAWSDRYSDRSITRAGVSIVQALLRGRPVDVNLAALRQAELQTRISVYELRGFAQALLAGVEEKYWEYTLARHQVRIFEESMALADTQLQQTRELIRVGRLAETELVAGRAEMALRRQELIQATSFMETSRLELLRLLNPPGADLWEKEIDLLTAPVQPEIELERVQDHVALAMVKRPDLNQARLLIDIGEIEIVRTKNGLLPQMDLFIGLGKTGYADSFGGSLSGLTKDGYDALAGLSFSRPVYNRNARAQHRRAQLSLDQTQEAVTNLRLLIELDVRSAYIQTHLAREQIGASQATRLLQEEKLRIETEKFRVGRSTNFLVAQAQRDLVRSRITEIQAVADYLISLTRLHLVEGSLLERRGIEIMG